MKRFDQWWMPDDEEHLPHNMKTVNRKIDGRLTYQYMKYEMALDYCKERRLAIDVGGHIGLWSFFMARDFEFVNAFEPMPSHRECWEANMTGKENAFLHPYALGETNTTVALRTRTPGSSGDTGVETDTTFETIEAKQRKLDTFFFAGVDLIKIDCEGYEEFVLRGGAETIERWKPCVIVEQKPGHSAKYGLEQNSAVKFLESLGAKQRTSISGDYILSWD